MTMNRSKRVGSALLLLLITPIALFAQIEPCGFYEVDGEPGYDDGDFFTALSLWRSGGSDPTLPDVDDNDIVDIRDLVVVGGCVRNLGRGLLARYWGFENGEPGQDIAFPDFDNLPGDPDPVVVNATPSLEDFEGYNGFLNSDMRHQFGAVFTGYLFVPEPGPYQFLLQGRRGARFIIDGNQILFFDGAPGNDTTGYFLEYGLHPIRVEYYTDAGDPEILLAWKSSTLDWIPNSYQTIGPEHLYHGPGTIPPGAVSKMELIVDPPWGVAHIGGGPFEFKTYVMSANTDVDLWVKTLPRTMVDGAFYRNLQVNQRVNEYPIYAEDSDGRSVSLPYTFYVYQPPAEFPGLSATLHTAEWYDGAIPDVETLPIFDTATTSGTQLDIESDGQTLMGDRYVSRMVVTELEGLIDIDDAGHYEFRINQPGALFINGKKIAAINYDYEGQWDSRGDVPLAQGANHYRMVIGRTNEGPRMRVYWSRDNGPESLIPDSVFFHNSRHIFEPEPLQETNDFGRTPVGLVCEYTFRGNRVWEDRSNNGHDLVPDPRAFVRPGGGITYATPGTISSVEAGTRLGAEVVASEELSLEVEFVVDEINDWSTRELISLTNPTWRTHASVFMRNDNLYFYLSDGDQDWEIQANDVVTAGQRTHVIATFKPFVMSLWVNNVKVAEQGGLNNIDLERWENILLFNIGQAYRRTRDPSTSDRQMFGTFLVAAGYAKELGPLRVQQNFQANQALAPIPGPLELPDPVVYPRAGTTEAELDEAHHLLNRMTFGPSPDATNELLTYTTPNGWINWQMDPDNIDDSALEDYLASGIFDPDHSYRDLVGEMLFRMIRSRRQLLEVMTWFWENHFSTELAKVDSLREERLENGRFRANALGSFADLVLASAKGYPMTIYLDNNTNIVGAPNENYARELLELHTFGVNNGYTQADIEELSRCFTGWTVRNGEFYFDPGLHDYGEKNLLGITIPAGGGSSDGLDIINYLVTRQETADFISWKLCQVFIADDPPADVVTAAATTFHNTTGDIKATIQTIISHPRFRTDLAYRGNKVRTPLEFVTAMTRLTEGHPVAPSLVYYLERMGMRLFEFADPTGFAEEGVAWIDTNSLLERWNLVNDMSANRGYGMTTSLDLVRFFAKYGSSDHNDILDLFEDLTTHGTEPAGFRAIAESWLTDDAPGSFVLNDETLDTRVRQTLSLFLRLPELNTQ